MAWAAVPINNRFWDNLFRVVFCAAPQVQKTIHSEEHVAMCGLLVAKRQAHKLTQAELADRLAMPQSFVSKVERGERLLDVIEFARYIKALGIDPVKAFSELVQAIQKPVLVKTSRPVRKSV